MAVKLIQICRHVVGAVRSLLPLSSQKLCKNAFCFAEIKYVQKFKFVGIFHVSRLKFYQKKNSQFDLT